MSLRFWLGFAFAFISVAPAPAQEPPEKLLSPSTQLFVKWDGVTAHAGAYKGSALGAVMAGPTGDTIRTLLAKGPKLLGANLLAEPLLDGRPPQELKAVHADLKNAEKVLDLLVEKGFIVSAEVNEPRPTIAGIGKALGGLLNGNGPAPDSFLPDARVFVIVPEAGDKSEVLFGGIRLLVRQANEDADPLPPALERK